jgi:hypothetical protein
LTRVNAVLAIISQDKSTVGWIMAAKRELAAKG